MRYTPAAVMVATPNSVNLTHREPSPTAVVNAYLNNSLNVSIDYHYPLPRIPHTKYQFFLSVSVKLYLQKSQPTGKRMSMQDRYREIAAKIVGGTGVTTPAAAGPHVTIFRPSIQNVTIINNYPTTKISHSVRPKYDFFFPVFPHTSP